MAILAMGVDGVGAYMIIASPDKEAIGTSQENGDQNVTGKWMDIHGVGVFTAEKHNSLYLATHNGLFKKENGNSSGWVKSLSQNSIEI